VHTVWYVLNLIGLLRRLFLFPHATSSLLGDEATYRPVGMYTLNKKDPQSPLLPTRPSALCPYLVSISPKHSPSHSPAHHTLTSIQLFNHPHTISPLHRQPYSPPTFLIFQPCQLCLIHLLMCNIINITFHCITPYHKGSYGQPTQPTATARPIRLFKFSNHILHITMTYRLLYIPTNQTRLHHIHLNICVARYHIFYSGLRHAV